MGTWHREKRSHVAGSLVLLGQTSHSAHLCPTKAGEKVPSPPCLVSVLCLVHLSPLRLRLPI